MTTLQKVGIGVGAAVLLNGVLAMRKGKSFFSLGLGDAQVYTGDPSIRTSDFNRRGQVRGSWSLQGGGLSSHQVRFGNAARSCSGRGQSQFRSCMSRSLRGR